MLIQKLLIWIIWQVMNLLEQWLVFVKMIMDISTSILRAPNLQMSRVKAVESVRRSQRILEALLKAFKDDLSVKETLALPSADVSFDFTIFWNPWRKLLLRRYKFQFCKWHLSHLLPIILLIWSGNNDWKKRSFREYQIRKRCSIKIQLFGNV